MFRISEISRSHASALTQLGMKVNETKSEVVIFTKKGHYQEEFDVAGASITSQHTMKILGVTFDDNLSWCPHVTNVVK